MTDAKVFAASLIERLKRLQGFDRQSFGLFNSVDVQLVRMNGNL